MKAVAILLLVALMLNGCSSNSTATRVAASATWQAVLSGGIADASGLSFNTQFQVNGDGSLNIESFQFLTDGTCFPDSNGVAPSASGTMILTVNTSTDQIMGTFSYTVQEGGNTLALTGTVTGTEVGTTFTNALVTGKWTLTGSGACNDTNSGLSFTMTQQPASS